MKWKLKKEEKFTEIPSRIYGNDTNNTEIETVLLYTDILGQKWYGFKDLFTIPYIRLAYSKTISDLFQVGLTNKDLTEWIQKQKDILKSNDKEKYEKLYSLVLEMEGNITTVTDPMKQHLALCTIYVLSEDEAIDIYTPAQASKKLDMWAQDMDAQAFFLNWHSEHIQRYLAGFNSISQIVSMNRGETPPGQN